MASLNNFPQYASDDQIPLCEINGKIFCSTPDFLNLHLYTNSVTNHPKVIITKDGIQHSLAKLFPGEVFLPGSDSLFQRLQDARYESGFKKVFEILKSENSLALKCIGQTFNLSHKLYEILFNSLNLPDNEILDNKKRDIVVCMAWHPSSMKLAVATNDDTITIYSENSNVTPILKAKAQRRVTEIAWRPLTSGELAVACSAGVYIWSVDPNSVISRPTFNSAILLPDKYVTSLAWSPHGDILMTCNGRDNFITAWDPETKKSISLKRIYGGGITKLSWSPDGSKLVAATSSKIFRVWKRVDWSYDTWLTVRGQLSHCVWSQNGFYLLFTTTADHCIYCLPAEHGMILNEKEKGAYLAADLSRIQIGSEIVGGLVKGMAWDKSNLHLAVFFEDSSYIAIYYTDVSSTFVINPGFFILGLPNEIPIFICFEQNFTEGSNLTISWSSGRVQYFPMIFPTDALSKSNIHTSLD